ncbi:Stage II sporulation protein M [uncultured archaeon]|nr:Stage II sporulation protein M [uncultured archaeon]
MVALSSLLMLPYVIKIFEFDELDVDIETTSTEQLNSWVRKCLRDGFSPRQIKDSLITDNLDKPYELMYDLTGVDKEYKSYMKSTNVFTRHWPTIVFHVALFLGAAFAYMCLYGGLGEANVPFVFENQLNVIQPGPHGLFVGGDVFRLIVVNNLRITLICVLLSLVYGCGAVFILNYNASIAGVMYGSSLRALFWGASKLYPNILMYLPHTTIEIFAYLLAAVSGSIISKATMGHPGGRILFRDGFVLLVLSIVLIVFAAAIEVNVLNALAPV